MAGLPELEELKRRLGIIPPGKSSSDQKTSNIDVDINEDRDMSVPVSDMRKTAANIDRDQDPFGIGIPLSELIPTSNQLRRRMILESYLMRFVDYDMVVSSSPGTALYEGQEYTLNDLSGTITEDGENFKATVDMVSPIITPKGKGLLVKVSIFANGKKIDETIIGGKNQDEIKMQIKILLERARIKYRQMQG